MTEVDIIALLEKEMANKSIKCYVVEENRVVMEVNANDIKAGVSALLKEYKPRFVTLVATDNGLDMELMYHFSVDSKIVTLSTLVPKETNQIESITDIVPAAEFIEEEVSELFGTNFEGNPRTVNLLLPDDWATGKKPLSKPLVGSLPLPARFEIQNLLSSGSAIGIMKSATDKREQAGLPKLPPLAGTSEDSIKEFQEFIKRTGFGKRADYDWEKGKLRYR